MRKKEDIPRITIIQDLLGFMQYKSFKMHNKKRKISEHLAS